MAGEWTAKLAGKFLVIDGPDGAGKSTQLALLAELLRAGGLDVCETRDPGGTPIGDRIRQVLLERDNGGMAQMCETFLFMASRAQLVAEVIRPALARGQTVLCDRFVSSTIAYQGALGVDSRLIAELGEKASEGLWPDLTVVLDLPPQIGMSRIGVVRKRLKDDRVPTLTQPSLFGDRLEVRTSDYHEKVRLSFLSQARADPARFVVVDGAGTVQDVHQRIVQGIRGRLAGG